MKSIGRWSRSHCDASSRPGSSRPLIRSRKGQPSVDLAVVEAVGPSQVLQSLGLPVDLGQPSDAVDQLVGEALTGVEVGEERFGPLGLGDGGPAVDEPHQVEGAAQHRRVVAHRDRFGVGHVGAGQGVDDPPLAEDARCPRRRCRARRDPQRRVQVAAADLVDLVLAASRDVALLERRARAGQSLGVEPAGQRLGIEDRVGAHRFPTSCSRYSAYFSRAVASFLVLVSVGHRSSLGR